MWIFLNDGFFSIVQHPKHAQKFQVRARRKGDLEKVFKVSPKTVIKMPHRDYMYRVYLAKSYVTRVLAQRILDIDYGNFKDSISKNEPDRKSAYSGVWAELYGWQDDMHPKYATKNWYENYRGNSAYQSAMAFEKFQLDDEPIYDEEPQDLYDVYTGINISSSGEYQSEDDDHQELYPSS